MKVIIKCSRMYNDIGLMGLKSFYSHSKKEKEKRKKKDNDDDDNAAGDDGDK